MIYLKWITFSIFCCEISAQVVINEFLASNLITAPDQGGDYGDWIELYNPTENSVSLSGYYLSDDIDNLNKWEFPQDDSLFNLPADGYVILWADGEPEQGLNHVSFNLDKNGEEIVITAPDGQTIIDQKTFGYQWTDISMGRDSLDNNIWSYFISPTIRSENGVGNQGITETPTIFPWGGHFDQPQSISITNSDNSQSIHY